ncbi:MAG: hypothetical protein R3236_09035 [Phycisphaeraceae bacterium]|nr:hypothetical protein [Phycisphaeraceae bacterium]
MKEQPQPMEPTLHIICPNLRCKRLLAVPASARGKTVRCKNCRTNVKVPQKPAAQTGSESTSS